MCRPHNIIYYSTFHIKSFTFLGGEIGMAAQNNWKIPRLYGNQKAIKIKKRKCDAENYYAIINLDSLQYALENLNGTAFKLWVWLCKNKNDYCFGLSGQVVQKELGVSKATYDKAVKELINKQFLRQGIIGEGIQGYIFTELGQIDEVYDEELQFKIKKEQVVTAAQSNWIEN